jgi:hypothetical protein
LDPGEIREEDESVGASPHPDWIEILDVAKALSVPRGKALEYATVNRGELVAEGDILAARPVLGTVWQRTCVAPIGGRIADLTDGLIFIRTPGHAREEGPVASDEGNGNQADREEITGQAAAVVRGVWGGGDSAHGPLRLLVSSPTERLNPRGIGPEFKGAVIVIGSLLDGALLSRAVRVGVHGLVAGGVDPWLVRKAPDTGVPMLVTEGAGPMPMNETIFELLSEHEGTEVRISGGRAGEWGGADPELVIPLSGDEDLDVTELPGRRPLEAGDSVRLTRAPYQGESGIVIGPEPRLTVYRSGIRCSAVWVQLSDGRRVYVPYTNLELMTA